MAIGDTYEVSIVSSHTTATGALVNVLHYVQEAVVVTKTESEYCNELAAEVRNITENDWMPNASDQLTLDRVDCFNVDQPTFQGTVASGVVGVNAAESLSPRQAAVATKATALRGKSFRGRMFIPGLTEGGQNAGEIETSTLAFLQTYVDNLIALALSNLNEYGLVVRSKKLFSSTSVTSMAVKTDIGTIKGRKKVLV